MASKFAAALADLAGANELSVRVGGRHPHVVQGRGAGQEIEALEDETDAAAAKLRQLRAARAVVTSTSSKR